MGKNQDGQKNDEIPEEIPNYDEKNKNSEALFRKMRIIIKLIV